MGDWVREIFRGRPLWLNAVLAFSGWMAFVYVPWDIFLKPVEHDAEVWFGIVFTGQAAKWAALPHWFLYGAFVYGIRHRRPWMRFWGAAYSAQVAFSMFVWSMVKIGGVGGFVAGVIPAVPFLLLALAFWNATGSLGPQLGTLAQRYGAWALVTGASAGVGAEFARVLAREGFSLVLSARREERLQTLAAELEKQWSISTRVVAIDLAEPSGADRLADAVADLEIGLLVNNAGLGYAGRLDKQDPDRLRGLITVNCVAPTVLSNRLLAGPAGMLARGRGAVIFTGSAAGRQPMPLHAVYAATKAYDLFLGEALHLELEGSGIDVLVLEPGSLATEFQEVAGEVTHVGTPPREAVELALDRLGVQASVLTTWTTWLRANAASRISSRPLAVYLAREYMRNRTPEDTR